MNHAAVDDHARFLLGDNRKVRQARDGEFAVILADERRAFVDVFVDSRSGDVVERRLLARFEAEENLHFELLHDRKQHRQRFHVVAVLLDDFLVALEALAADLHLARAFQLHRRHDAEPDRIGEIVFRVDGVQIRLQPRDVGALDGHIQLVVRDEHRRLHPSVLHGILVKKHFHAQNFLDKRLDRFHKIVLGRLVKFQIRVVILHFLFHVDFRAHGR